MCRKAASQGGAGSRARPAIDRGQVHGRAPGDFADEAAGGRDHVVAFRWRGAGAGCGGTLRRRGFGAAPAPARAGLAFGAGRQSSPTRAVG